MFSKVVESAENLFKDIARIFKLGTTTKTATQNMPNCQ